MKYLYDRINETSCYNSCVTFLLIILQEIFIPVRVVLHYFSSNPLY